MQMETLRLSRPEDIPALGELWRLAFGDDGAYVDNFFKTYYRPERMLVLEAEGAVRAMTAWFDTAFVVPGRGEYRAAYLYAVATHPHWRSRGLSGRLLAWADGYFRSLGIPAVTTVPARPSLHSFFAGNGFGECFCHFEGTLAAGELPPAGDPVLRRVGPAEYGGLREGLLSGLPHIAYPEDALAYQAGCCALGAGGLLAGDTADGPVCLCAEEAGEGLVVVKELLGGPAACRAALADLGRAVPARRWTVRTPRPLDLLPSGQSPRQFGMLKWLGPGLKTGWDWSAAAHLGLAFD